mmetsp:Transcript_95161/g.168131  ORF Transcript_95161/g.168131 Transcript_95161/m.168131 type:complete len:545 (-) Transcript_95161:53-1687(-)
MLLIFAALGCTISSVPFVRAESVESADELLFNDTCDSHHVSLLQENLVHPAMRTKRVSIDEHALADKVHVELLHSREEKTQQPPNSRSDLWPLWAPLVGLMLVNVVWLALLFLIGNIDDDAGVEPETPGRIALAESAPSLRDVPLDHLKWFLVGLVCLDYSFRVHGASNVEDWDFWQWLLEKGHWDHHMVQSLVFVNIFVTPTLCFLSGHFSRNYVRMEDIFINGFEVSVPKNKLQRALIQIMLVCIVAEFMKRNIIPAFARFFWYGDHEAAWQDLTMPLETLPWYLCALAVWRTFLPFWSTLQFPITFAFGMALVPAFCPILSWTWCRIFGYLPFFICGLQVSASKLDSFQKGNRHQIGGVVVMVFFVLLLKNSASMQGLFALFKYSDSFDMPPGLWGVVRPLLYYPMALLGISACLSVAQLAFARSWGTMIDKMSTRSLYVYLFHPLIVRQGARAWGAYMNDLTPWMQIWWSVNVSFSTLVLLTSFPVYQILSSICEPPLGWLFYKAEQRKGLANLDAPPSRQTSSASNLDPARRPSSASVH